MANEEYIVPLDFIGSHVSVNNTKEHCLVSSLRYLQKHGFTIHGLKKTARGNSHDENWQDKYSVIGDGGPFANTFKDASEQKKVLYVDSPIVEHLDSLTDEAMQEWSQPFQYYSGEEEHRYIYATRDNKEMYVFDASSVFIQTADKSWEYEKTEWGLRKEIYTLKVICHKTNKENT